jgi:hypothetical protein
MEASSKKILNLDLPYDPAILLLGRYLKECDSGYYKGTFHKKQIMETAKMPLYQ